MGKTENLEMQQSGWDFFRDAKAEIFRTISESDRSRVSVCLEKEALIAQLADGQPFSITFRANRNGVSSLYNMKIVRSDPKDDHYLVIGLKGVEPFADRKEGFEQESLKLPDMTLLWKAFEK